MGSKPLVRQRSAWIARGTARAFRGSADVPSLFRFLTTLAILGALIYAGMFALATFVEPTPREMSVSIPNSKLQPQKP